MNGFERLDSMVKDQEDIALIQTVNYLKTRKEFEKKYLNEEKTLEGMCNFIRDKGMKHYHNGWNYITNEVVYSWAVMYFVLPNSYLKINDTSKEKNKSEKTTTQAKKKNEENNESKNNVVQFSLFGGGSSQ